MHISVIGSGYVGLVTGACFAEFGVHVTCMDSDSRRIEKLEKGDVPFYEPGLKELVAKGIKEGRLSFTTDIAKAVEKRWSSLSLLGLPLGVMVLPISHMSKKSAKGLRGT